MISADYEDSRVNDHPMSSLKSIGSSHKYITIVMDLESGAIIFVGKGKG